MKKTLLAMIAALCLGNVCHAQISNGSCALGGLTCGLPLTKVVEFYGTPQTKDEYNNMTFDNGSLKVMTNHGRREKVDRVYVTDDNGCTTPEGIRVGSSLDQVISTYGNPDMKDSVLYVYIAPNRECLFFWHDGSKVTSMELHPFFC